MDFSNITNVAKASDFGLQGGSAEPELDRHAFLKLFTAQLKNQDPLEPLKNEAFVAQLAQFPTLEATTTMSNSFSQFVNDQRSENLMKGASLIGKNVFLEDSAFFQRGGEPVPGFAQLESGADQVVVTVLNAESGKEISKFGLGPRQAGELSFVWNGGDGDNKQASTGFYRFQVETIRAGVRTPVSSSSPAEVEGVGWDSESGKAYLELSGGYSLPLGLVKKISD